MRNTITLLLLAGTSFLFGQDTRTVAEPQFPPACAVLTAKLSAPGGALPEASETQLDTARIQEAIDQCAPGKAVELKPDGARNIFLMSPIRLKAGVTLLVDAGAAIFGSRNPRDYEDKPGNCGTMGVRGAGCKPLILADRAPGAGIMGDGAIDGRGGADLLGQKVSWWDLAKQAKVMDSFQTVPRMIVVRASDNFTMYRITLRNSTNFHVTVNGTNGFTAWGVKIRTPKTARNSDGIDPSSSTNVTITHCDIATGDDNVAIKTSMTAPASHMTISHNRFYSGHGMSIGSGTAGGVHAIRVSDLTIDGADNGIRIKSDRSRGGLVEDVTYENVCMRDVTNPIVLTPWYTTNPGERLPVYRNIVLKDVTSVTKGWYVVMGLDGEHKLGVSFDNVNVAGLEPGRVTAKDADVAIGPRRGNFVPAGANVTVTDAGASAGVPLSCQDRFVPPAQIPTAPEAAQRIPPEDPTFYVAASGTGDYYSIQRAIDQAPAEGGVISIAPGVYRELINITKPNIHLRSPYTDPAKTVIVFNQSASTGRTPTMVVSGDGFTAENLTIENDYNATHKQEFSGSQALALRITGDRAALRNVRILGNQDTLYLGTKNCPNARGDACQATRQYFSHCVIQGNVDFIFGDSKAVFEDCELRSTNYVEGFITAQGKHYPQQDSIFVFNRCKLTAEPGVKDIYLGRPWRDYSSTVFLNTEMGEHVRPVGWREWHPGETKRIETAFYGEHNSTGPGAHPEARDPHIKKLTAEEAARYEPKRVLAGEDGWDPAAAHQERKTR